MWAWTRIDSYEGQAFWGGRSTRFTMGIWRSRRRRRGCLGLDRGNLHPGRASVAESAFAGTDHGTRSTG